MSPDVVVDYLPHATGLGGFLTLLLYLLKRSDARDKSAYDKLLFMVKELRRQRDKAWERLEKTEEELEYTREQLRRARKDE